MGNNAIIGPFPTALQDSDLTRRDSYISASMASTGNHKPNHDIALPMADALTLLEKIQEAKVPLLA